MLRRCFFALGALLIAGIGSTVAPAATITELGGTFGNVEATGTSLTLGDAEITTMGPDSVAGLTLDPVVIDLSAFAGSPGSVALDPITISLGAQTATLNVSSAVLYQVTTTPVGGGLITGAYTGTTDIPDLSSLIGPGGNFLISFNGIVVNAGGTADVSDGATASITFVAIPEPASIVLAAVGAVGLLLVRRRRR